MGARTVRLGLIGCGAISRSHLRNLGATPGAEIAALVDVSDENLARTVEAFPGLTNVPTYRDYRELLAGEPDLDGVLVLTPHALHYEQVRDALEAGRHVLSEKPFVTRPEQARELIALARERGRVLMLSYQNALLWPYRYTRQAIEDGTLGEIVFCSGQITQNWGRDVGGWRQTALGEGGFLIDTGSHFVDLLLYLTGMRPEAVCALIDDDGRALDIVTGALIRFNGGRVATLATAGVGPTLWSITIIGTGGTIELTDRDNIRHIGADNYAGWIGTERRNLVPPEGRRPETTTPDAEFVAAIQRDDLAASDAARGLTVALVTQAIYASASQGGAPVPIPALE